MWNAMISICSKPTQWPTKESVRPYWEMRPFSCKVLPSGINWATRLSAGPKVTASGDWTWVSFGDSQASTTISCLKFILDCITWKVLCMDCKSVSVVLLWDICYSGLKILTRKRWKNLWKNKWIWLNLCLRSVRRGKNFMISLLSSMTTRNMVLHLGKLINTFTFIIRAFNLRKSFTCRYDIVIL